MSNKLPFESFSAVVNKLIPSNSFNYEYLYEIYSNAFEGINELEILKPFGEIDISNFELINYCLGEYIYSTSHRNPVEMESFINDEKIKESMSSVVADKYISLNNFLHKENKLTNQFFPPISSLNVYVNLMATIVNAYSKKDPSTTLISDLLFKAINIIKSIITLLVEGFETQAFTCWRTLHECECTLVLLAQYGQPLINEYLIHMNYGLAFKGALGDEEKQNKVFADMKEEMKKYDLKSKDIKKFIEYGWLYGVPNIDKVEDFKLNFRDGLEKLAGLTSYSERYEGSSEIIHSTPLLIYSNKEYYYYMTLLSTYESFFRIEKVFTALFAPRVNKEALEKYAEMRNIYYSQLINIHKRETIAFNEWTNKIGK